MNLKNFLLKVCISSNFLTIENSYLIISSNFVENSNFQDLTNEKKIAKKVNDDCLRDLIKTKDLHVQHILQPEQLSLKQTRRLDKFPKNADYLVKEGSNTFILLI